MTAPTNWYVEPDSSGNPTLWAPNEDRPDYPTALLVRVPSNADLFDGIGVLLDQVAQVAADALEIDRERMEAEARATEAEEALEKGDACGHVGCRALADRDAAEARLERVRELADEWERKYVGHYGAAANTDSEVMAGLQVASGSVRKLCADEVRATLADTSPLTEAEDSRERQVDDADDARAERYEQP